MATFKYLAKNRDEVGALLKGKKTADTNNPEANPSSSANNSTNKADSKQTDTPNENISKEATHNKINKNETSVKAAA